MDWFKVSRLGRNRQMIDVTFEAASDSLIALRTYFLMISSYDFERIDEALASVEGGVEPKACHATQSDDMITIYRDRVVVENVAQPEHVHDHLTTIPLEKFKEVYLAFRNEYLKGDAGD